MATEPGWYQDPAGSKSLRWWDGEKWTQHTQAAPVVHKAIKTAGVPDNPESVIQHTGDVGAATVGSKPLWLLGGGIFAVFVFMVGAVVAVLWVGGRIGGDEPGSTVVQTTDGQGESGGEVGALGFCAKMQELAARPPLPQSFNPATGDLAALREEVAGWRDGVLEAVELAREVENFSAYEPILEPALGEMAALDATVSSLDGVAEETLLDFSGGLAVLFVLSSFEESACGADLQEGEVALAGAISCTLDEQEVDCNTPHDGFSFNLRGENTDNNLCDRWVADNGAGTLQTGSFGDLELVYPDVEFVGKGSFSMGLTISCSYSFREPTSQLIVSL